jgi:hypothetical protein
VAGGGEGDEQHAADDADGDGQHGEHLPGVLGRHRVEAGHDVLVEERDGGEDHDGHHGVREVDGPDPVRRGGLRVERRAAVDDPEPPERGEAVAHGAPAVPEAVGGAEHEAGERARHGAVGADAVALRRHHRGQQLERQHRARREQRRQVRRALVRLADGALDRTRPAALEADGALRQERPLLLVVVLGFHVVVADGRSLCALHLLISALLANNRK